MSRVLLAFSFFVILLNNLCAQKQIFFEISYTEISKKIEKYLLENANKVNGFQEYDAAIKNYSELLRIDSTNSKNNYAMAITLYSNFQQPNSIPFLEKAIRYSKDTIPEAFFFLANSFHLSGNYDKAKQNYTIYLSLLEHDSSFLPKGEKENAKIDITNRIEMCENGKYLSSSSPEKSPLFKKGKHITISDIGSNINTSFDDFGAVFAANDSTLYFTSRREDNGNIYVSPFETNRLNPSVNNDSNSNSNQSEIVLRSSPLETRSSFSPPLNKKRSKFSPKSDEKRYSYAERSEGDSKSLVENIGWPINDAGYETILNLSSDGKRIYFYKSDDKEGSVYYSDFLNNHWNFPYPVLNKYEVNNTFSKTNIYGYALSADLKELFLISDKVGGKGGKDIYVSKKMSDDTWGLPENIGTPINTQFDELALSLSPDGNTMYFSSNGNKSIGGFDVFVTYRKDDKWSQPVNLGIPINTPGDDLFFSFLHNNTERATYSSNAYGSKNKGDLDLYLIDFCDDVKENTIKGITLGMSTGAITIIDNVVKSDTIRCSIINGKYSISLKVGRRYNFIFETNGIQPVSIEIGVPMPTQCKRYDIYQEITFTKPGEIFNLKSTLLDIAYGKINPDITTYPAFMKKADKTRLLSYYERNRPTYSAETLKTSNPPVVYDKITDKKLSKDSVSNSSDSSKIKEINKFTGKKGTTFIFNSLLFSFGNSEIEESFKVELDTVVEFLKHVKPDSKIVIGGYSDSKGIPEYNLELSEFRAGSVAAYLMSKDININRIKIVGYGASNPVAPNKKPDGTDNPEGRAKNRRIEIVIE